MIKTENDEHKCTACSCTYTDDEGGIQGYFGILYMSFCPACLSSIMDMADQLRGEPEPCEHCGR